MDLALTDPDVPRPPQEENSMADIAEIQTGLAEIGSASRSRTTSSRS